MTYLRLTPVVLFGEVMKKVILVLILILAMALRVIGTSPGYPPYHSDEGISYSSAVDMIKNKNLDPTRYDYPALVPLANFFVFKTIFIPVWWVKFYLINLGGILEGFINLPLDEHAYKKAFQLEVLGERELNALFWGRLTTAIFGVGVVYLLYLVVRKTYGENTALVASLLVAVNYRQVLNSHLGLPDIYNAFFLLLAFLATLKLLEKPTASRYLVVGITCGLSFSVKYQNFSFFPLLLSHVFISLRQTTWKQRVRTFFATRAFLVPIVVILTVLLANPYHFIKIEQLIDQLSYVSTKYIPGKNIFDIYPYSYLYHIGIGQLTSIFVVLGLLVSLARMKEYKKLLLILSLITPFFFVMTYYSQGGFYTRNFVTITPFLLIFPAIFIARIVSKLPRLVKPLLMMALTAILAYENLVNSIVVSKEYTKPWNFRVVSGWLLKNLPPTSKVSAHSSVPIPVESVERLSYDFHLAFSLEEFRDEGADYVILNTDWVTNDFYGWMGGRKKDKFRYWNKPIDELERSYSAMAIREVSDYAVYSAINPWQAPDSNFIVSKVPRFKLLERVKAKDFSINSEVKVGGWQSDAVKIDDWSGFSVEADVKTESARQTKDGFIYVSFYANEDDAREDKNRITSRLSKRNNDLGKWVEIRFMGEVAKTAKYARVGVGIYDSAQTKVEVGVVRLYKSKVEVDVGGVKPSQTKLDRNLIFPNSHGYL